MEANTETLLQIGFRDVAKWVQGKGLNLAFELDGVNVQADKALLQVPNALYAFVYQDVAVYIGKTTQRLQQRLGAYRNPPERLQTNFKCNQRIREHVSRGETVRIFCFHSDFAFPVRAV